MHRIPKDASVRDHVIASIITARSVCAAYHAVALDFGPDRAAVEAMIGRLEQNVLFAPSDHDVLGKLAGYAFADIARAYPARTEALAQGCVPPDPLGEEDAERSRQLLLAISDFARHSQRVIDESLADRLLCDLSRRRG
jgi:hypothetical protein